MDLGKNPAEHTGECGLRIVMWNWVKSESWWNLQVCEICKWVKREKEVRENVKLGEIWKLVKSASSWDL